MATKDETRVRAVDAVTGVVLTTFKHAAIERMQGKGSWVHVNERGEFWQVPR